MATTGLLIRPGQMLTFFVSCCPGRMRCRLALRYGRQVVGRYFESRVLGVQTHAMLPAWLVGESTRYWLAEVMALLAFGPW